MISKPLTPVGALVRGALAGAAGVVAMDLVWYRRYRRGGGDQSFREWQSSADTQDYDSAGAPAKVGKRLVEGLFDTELKPDTAGVMNTAVHWLTGIGYGMVHGITAGSRARLTARSGLGTGVLAFLTSYTILPATGLYKPLWEYDAETLGKDLSAHLAFGLGTGVAFRLLALPFRPARAG